MTDEETQPNVASPPIAESMTKAARVQLATKSKPMKSAKLVAGVGARVGGKGLSLSKPGTKRHSKKLRDNIQGITAPALRRLARRGGVKRMDGKIYETSRLVLKVFLEDIIRDAVMYTEHAQRKTVLTLDVVRALRRNGKTLFGYDG